MTKSPPSKVTTPSLPTHPKLPRLPSNYKIQKRPLLHAPIAGPRTSSSTPKIVYVSASSNFIATVKRVRKLLGFIEARETAHVKLGKGGGREVLKAIREGIEGERKGRKGGVGEEVVVKATGRAIERGLQVAVWFLGQEDVRVRVGTGSVGAVDDVVLRDGVEEGEVEVEESRVRRASVLEVGISLR